MGRTPLPVAAREACCFATASIRPRSRRRIAAPALVVYGAEDDIIPAEHSERLAAAWGGPVERLRIDGHGHNDLDLDPPLRARHRRVPRSAIDGFRVSGGPAVRESPPMKNDNFLRALLRQPTDYTPIWIMRQAGRYLPEYNATRKKAGSFLALAKNPEFACEVTLQPLERFALDAAILFSDILTIPDAMGLGLYFAEGEGPKFERTVRTEEDVRRLPVADMDELQYVFDAVSAHPQVARRPRAAHRLLRQPLHARLLHDRRRRQRRLPPREVHALRAAGPAARASWRRTRSP